MKQIRQRLTYANVMSSIAVFLILGGATAFAATKIGAGQLKANSVKTGKIVKEAVTEGKIKNGAVTTNKLANGAVTTDKIANDAVTGDKVKESTLGEVPSAAKATSATSATSAANATTADGPVAFAHVSAGGALLDGRGVSVSPGNATYYCFSGLAFEPRGIQATADYWNGSPQFNTMVQAGLASSGGLGGTGCPAGTQAFVHGVEAGDDTPTVAAFYAVFFK